MTHRDRRYRGDQSFKGLRPWSEVARIWNAEHPDQPLTKKQVQFIGLNALCNLDRPFIEQYIRGTHEH